MNCLALTQRIPDILEFAVQLWHFTTKCRGVACISGIGVLADGLRASRPFPDVWIYSLTSRRVGSSPSVDPRNHPSPRPAREVQPAHIVAIILIPSKRLPGDVVHAVR
jgi:hypothetical protein